MGKSGPICWNCQEVGHRRRNCKNPSYCSKCKQSGHLPIKCPLKGMKTEKSQTQQRQQTSVNPMFSNIRNKCIRCRGDHAPGLCPTKTHPQVAQNTAGYQTDDNSAVAGKANTNALPSFSSKNGQPTAANMTPSSPKNSAGAQRCPSCAREPITPQVSPNMSQQNFYSTSECHPWMEEVHALCIQTGRPFHEMLLLCAGQAVRNFITDMSPEATDDQIKNDLITGYSDLQGLGCKQSAYDSIMQ